MMLKLDIKLAMTHLMEKSLLQISVESDFTIWSFNWFEEGTKERMKERELDTT